MLSFTKSRMLSGKKFIFIFALLITTCLYSTIINVPADQPTIQEGINVAVDTDTVLVQPGTYVENINYNGKLITVASLFLTTQDTTYISQTVIDGNQNGSVVICGNGENSTAVLTGLTITNGNNGGIHCSGSSSPSLNDVIITDNTTGWVGGGICCSSNSSPSLVNVTITGNSAYSDGGGIYCYINSSPSLVNVTITGNTADYGDGGGILCRNNCSLSLVNCILWNDSPQEIYFCENYDPNSITISYSDIEGGEAGIVTNNNGTVNWQEGNIDEDPLFVGTGGYPFSLLEDSPCIDAGNPDPIYYDPEDPGIHGYALYPAMGTVINDMGAYGGPNAIGWPVVGLDDDVIVQTPEVFLYQNFPNPFNPTTTINYSLKENSKVSLNIYNIKGQKVKQLISSQLSVGQHSVVWNGTDQTNKPVSSGIYFYKLKTENYEKVKRMILLK